MYSLLHNVSSSVQGLTTAAANDGNQRELLSNHRPPLDDAQTRVDILHLKRLSKNLISSITSPPLFNCLSVDASDALSYEEEVQYKYQCLESYLMASGHINNGSYDSVITNLSSETQQGIPEELTHINMTNLIAYSILFPLAAIGNLLVLVALFRSRHRKSRVNLMILHLSLADMIVTFIFLPMEIIWQVTIQWPFGRIGCKLYKFFSAFGFYMSSMVLVCISLDRYFAVLHPLRVNDAQRRGKIMLLFAWIISAFISLPQVSVVVRLEKTSSCYNYSVYIRKKIYTPQ